MPVLVLLRFIKVTGVEPQWLLSGEAQRYRVAPLSSAWPVASARAELALVEHLMTLRSELSSELPTPGRIRNQSQR
jgi:hypothetical protein